MRFAGADDLARPGLDRGLWLTDEVALLIRLVAPPARHRPVEWSNIEQALRVQLPEDYKGLIDAYGPGSFDGFIWIFQPASDNPNLDLLAQTRTQLASLRERRASEPDFAVRIYPELGGLLPWGITDNGDVGFWRVEPGDARWPLVVLEARGAERYEYTGGLAAFIRDVLTGRERVTFFPADFPSTRPAFTPE